MATALQQLACNCVIRKVSVDTKPYSKVTKKPLHETNGVLRRQLHKLYTSLPIFRQLSSSTTSSRANRFSPTGADFSALGDLSIKSPGYNLSMARGWESKAVEEQQAEASATSDSPGERLTPEQVAKQKQQQGLLLSRKRVLKQLQAAQNPFYRKMLETALGDLDARLARLG